MKRFLITATIFSTTLFIPAFAADVGVSVSIGQPGFYGQIDIGDFPQPRVIYAQPRIIESGRSIYREPIYLRVPPKHARNWKKHCREYNACGERVLFVKNDWYQHEYAPRYEERYRDQQDNGHDNRHDKDRDRGDHNGHGHNH